ncbi:DUF2190 family protein [Anaerotruncus sp. DFI.9.16]|uniref:DUF2190 family protein n=1 Tax=Anaerotruncus sp. DFI.9.16 TaxID=2965275 RepID=UPI00210B0050|nr:DUF2190 family protein [Anaerotruncus sp. DFI.9.16]MCQ4895544.1 DUF2190 family protein [Anaerotruncus sp. DFI.9.16]
MMATYVQKGENINYKNDGSEKIAYGDVVVISDRIGVASVDISAGETGVISLEGVYEMPAEASAAFEVGQTVYWDTTNKRLTATKPASGAIIAGVAIEPKATAASLALVKL